MELWQMLLLATLQGVTEFLPVSSSGHLVLLESVLLENTDSNLNLIEVNVVLHLGTLLTILVFYRRRIGTMIRDDRRTLRLLAVGTLPAIVVGYPFKRFFETALTNPIVAGILLTVTGVILLATSRLTVGKNGLQTLSYRSAFLIGLGQSAAVLPGLSRSGTTIATALWLGTDRRASADFSFLLAIPVIAGAGVLQAVDLMQNARTTTPLLNLAVGALVAFSVGILALRWLLKWLEAGRLSWFAWWCVPLGIVALIWHLAVSTPGS